MNYLKCHSSFKIAVKLLGRHRKGSFTTKEYPSKVYTCATKAGPIPRERCNSTSTSMRSSATPFVLSFWQNFELGPCDAISQEPKPLSPPARPNRSAQYHTARALVGLLQRTSSIFLARWWRCQTKTYKSWFAWSTRSQGYPCRLQPSCHSYSEVSHTWFLRVWISPSDCGIPSLWTTLGLFLLHFARLLGAKTAKKVQVIVHIKPRIDTAEMKTYILTYCKWSLQAFYLSKSSLLVHHKVRYLKKNLTYCTPTAQFVAPNPAVCSCSQPCCKPCAKTQKHIGTLLSIISKTSFATIQDNLVHPGSGVIIFDLEYLVLVKESTCLYDYIHDYVLYMYIYMYI